MEPQTELQRTVLRYAATHSDEMPKEIAENVDDDSQSAHTTGESRETDEERHSIGDYVDVEEKYDVVEEDEPDYVEVGFTDLIGEATDRELLEAAVTMLNEREVDGAEGNDVTVMI